ncbi:MAG: hypothetical protein JOZ94_21175 [Xanthobacteraceae bacterium]|nr:hypothetical protein [Xanthobacteraceae bacterium]MBV9632003.1 hypothetical protein [Xanthobacteraceae bacterium]
MLQGAGLITSDILTTYSVGALGCAMSHIALWKRGLAGGEVLTVAEDALQLPQPGTAFDYCANWYRFVRWHPDRVGVRQQAMPGVGEPIIWVNTGATTVFLVQTRGPGKFDR